MAVLKGYISEVYEEINDELPKNVFKDFAWKINTQMEYLREDLKVDEYSAGVLQIFDEKPSEMKYYGVDINNFDKPQDIVAFMVVLPVGYPKDFPRRFIDGMPVLNHKGYWNSFWQTNNRGRYFVCAIYKD